MKLENKKSLAARTLNIGKSRIIFNAQRLSEIKEAITKQDFKDLNSSGAINIREPKGRRKIVKSKTRRRAGSVRKTISNRKEEYMILTRKFRKYLDSLKKNKKISLKDFYQIRKEIKTRAFKNYNQIKDRVSKLEK